MSLKVLLLLFVSAIVPRCLSQSTQSDGYTVSTVTAKDGLKLHYIYAVHFDNYGLLWVAGAYSSTDSRFPSKKLILQRYNGYSFTDVEIPGQDDMLANMVDCMVKRPDGKFYLRIRYSNKVNMLLFDPVSLKMTEIQAHKNIKGELMMMREDTTGQYALYNMKDSLVMYRISDDLKYHYAYTLPKLSGINDFIYGIILLKDHILFSTNDLGIRAVSYKGKVIKSFDKHEPARFFRNNFIYRDSLFMCLSDSLLYYYDPDTKTFNRNLGSLNYLYSKHSVRYDHGADGSFTLSYPEENKRVYHYPKNYYFSIKHSDVPITFSINYNDVSITRLKNGSTDLWLARYGELHHISIKKSGVRHFLNRKSIRSILQMDNGNYLVATEDNGFYEINIQTENVKPFLLREGNKIYQPGMIRGMFQDNLYYWISGGYQIMRVRKDNGQMQSWGSSSFESMSRLPDGNILTGAFKGKLSMFSTSTHKFTTWADLDSLWQYDIRTYSNGTSYVATDKGIMRVDKDGSGQVFYGKPEGLTDNVILSLAIIPGYGLLAGSQQGRLYCLDTTNNRFKLLFEDTYHASIAGILADNDQRIWLNTFKGLIALDIKGGKPLVQRFTTNSGLCENEGNRYSMYKTPEGGIFSGTINGLNYFMPSDLVEIKNPARIQLLSALLPGHNSNASVLEQNLEVLASIKDIVMPAGNRNLYIEFGVAQALNSYDLNFQYRLDDQQWINIGTQNHIRLNNLAPGTYNLQIRMVEPSGELLGNMLELRIEAKDFFYNSGWFYLLIFTGLLILALYFIYLYRKRQQQQILFTHQLIRTQEDERFRISRDLHDSVGQHLILIKNKARQAQQTELEDIASNTLEDIRSITRSLHPFILQQFGISEALKKLVQSADESSGIFFSVDVEDITGIFDEQTELNVYRIVQELLNNIIKHSGTASAEVNLVKQNKQVVITVKDHGKGFSHKEALMMQQSLGMKTIQERSDMIGAQLKIQSVPGKETSVELIIPL